MGVHFVLFLKNYPLYNVNTAPISEGVNLRVVRATGHCHFIGFDIDTGKKAFKGPSWIKGNSLGKAFRMNSDCRICSGRSEEY
jgi:hypothetical protein